MRAVMPGLVPGIHVAPAANRERQSSSAFRTAWRARDSRPRPAAAA